MLKYFVPNIWATIPFVGGTVESHRTPNVIPKKIDVYKEGGRNINMQITTARAKYKILNNIYLLYFVPK